MAVASRCPRACVGGAPAAPGAPGRAQGLGPLRRLPLEGDRWLAGRRHARPGPPRGCGGFAGACLAAGAFSLAWRARGRAGAPRSRPAPRGVRGARAPRLPRAQAASPSRQLGPARAAPPDLAALLRVLPARIAEALRAVAPSSGAPHLEDLVELVADLGRPPWARFRRCPADALEVDVGDAPVTAEELREMRASPGLTAWTWDNRASVAGTLHRVALVRHPRTDAALGLTYRVGRERHGAAAPLLAALEARRSVLLLGPPGAGRTTALREASRALSDDLGRRVVVVDTVGELAGGSPEPHSAIGTRARRMLVGRRQEQHWAMLEAVRNHAPEAVVIDELATREDARAAADAARQGVAVLAAAHGRTLEDLLRNPELDGLLRGPGAGAPAGRDARPAWRRRARPVFDVVAELGAGGAWRVHNDAAAAVDLLLSGAGPGPARWALPADGAVAGAAEGAPAAGSVAAADAPTEWRAAPPTCAAPSALAAPAAVAAVAAAAAATTAAAAPATAPAKFTTVEELRDLFDRGMDPNCRFPNGDPKFFKCAMQAASGSSCKQRLFLQEWLSRGPDLGLRDLEGNTCLHHLVAFWHGVQLRGSKRKRRKIRNNWAWAWHALVAASADPRVTDAQGRTAWQMMRDLGVEEELTRLLQLPATATKPVGLAGASTEAHAAPVAGRAEVVAAAPAATAVGKGALASEKFKTIEELRDLFDRGLDPSCRFPNGDPKLFECAKRAARGKQHLFLQEWLNRGPDLGLRDLEGNTCLHHLVQCWHGVQLSGSRESRRKIRKNWAWAWHALVAASADPHAIDAQGRTVWQMMRDLGVEEELIARLERSEPGED